jgi:hypothetical protein
MPDTSGRSNPEQVDGLSPPNTRAKWSSPQFFPVIPGSDHDRDAHAVRHRPVNDECCVAVYQRRLIGSERATLEDPLELPDCFHGNFVRSPPARRFGHRRGRNPNASGHALLG